MDIRIDLSIVLVLLIFKLTLYPHLSFGVVLLPLIIGFLFNFTKGFIQGIKDKQNDL
tara:strand:- start:4515 stop:4685 length:171 start_codon:yes stop_codon:yes gene_type:complete